MIGGGWEIPLRHVLKPNFPKWVALDVAARDDPGPALDVWRFSTASLRHCVELPWAFATHIRSRTVCRRRESMAGFAALADSMARCRSQYIRLRAATSQSSTS